jgi:hypothetical protein
VRVDVREVYNSGSLRLTAAERTQTAAAAARTAMTTQIRTGSRKLFELAAVSYRVGALEMGRAGAEVLHASSLGIK